MPGNPFKRPFKGGKTRATPRRPQRPNAKVSHVPRPEMPNGISSRAVKAPASPRAKVTSKARKSLPLPRVRQGAQMGSPGKTGSRPGASYE